MGQCAQPRDGRESGGRGMNSFAHLATTQWTTYSVNWTLFLTPAWQCRSVIADMFGDTKGASIRGKTILAAARGRNGAAKGSPMKIPWPRIATLFQCASINVSPPQLTPAGHGIALPSRRRHKWRSALRTPSTLVGKRRPNAFYRGHSRQMASYINDATSIHEKVRRLPKRNHRRERENSVEVR